MIYGYICFICFIYLNDLGCSSRSDMFYQLGSIAYCYYTIHALNDW